MLPALLHTFSTYRFIGTELYHFQVFTPAEVRLFLRPRNFMPRNLKAPNVKADGVGFGPQAPAPGPITIRLRLDGLYPALADSDGVGFETIRYYLIINTIKYLYCEVLREIATTCDYAVTNCHETHLRHFQFKILP